MLNKIIFDKDEWMTTFYEKPWFIVKPNSKKKLYKKDLLTNKNCLYEWRINANKPFMLQEAFDLGFELVETAVEFETEISYKKPKVSSSLRVAKQKDLDEVLNLVDICYVNFDKFYNRLKNTKYFTQDKTTQYFQQGIINNFNNPDSVIIVAENNSSIVGFYIMKKVGEDIYKGISTGVHPSMRGKNLHIQMQAKCKDVIKKSYTVINRTQISNYKVLNNHIREMRHLTLVEYILYLKID